MTKVVEIIRYLSTLLSPCFLIMVRMVGKTHVKLMSLYC